jgi:fermentation-respiration switch protein FrsA (DUF1100 family)
MSRCLTVGLTGILILAGCAMPPLTLSTIFLRPTPDMIGTPADYGFDYDEVMVPVDEGREVAIWHVKAEQAKGIVVIIPGSDRNKSRYLIGLPVFVPNNYDVILMDYEGFGDSTGGTVDLARLSDDGCAVVAYAKTQNRRVIPFGISTGGSTAVRAAIEHDAAALILEAPLVLETEVEYWLRDNGVEHEGWWNLANLWVHPQIPDTFDIISRVTQVNQPLLLMHSWEDEVVPFESGLAVYANAVSPKTLFPMWGRHGEMIEIEPELYESTVIGWLNNIINTP